MSLLSRFFRYFVPNTRQDNGGGWAWRLGPLLRQSICDDGHEFLHRWGLVFPGFSVYLHRMSAADPGRDHHDHPWKARFLILYGGYIEERLVQGRKWRLSRLPGDVNSISHSTFHRVERLLGDTCWTLGVVWGRRGSWGFLTSQGLVDHTLYRADQRKSPA